MTRTYDVSSTFVHTIEADHGTAQEVLATIDPMRSLADRLRARGEQPVAVSADALQVYRGLEVLTGAASTAEQERLEHRLVSFLPVGETFSAGRYA